jgi:hypothetical protein
MARALNTDYYQGFRFAVSLGTPASEFIEVAAGFNNITTPELSLEATEYRDGITIYTKKQVGLPTVADSTWQQGVASTASPGYGQASPFLNWLFAAINGAEYRTEVSYWHLHTKDREDFDPTSPSSSRLITLNEAFPIRVKPDGDFDATSAEISMREMDVACESISVAAAVPGVAALANT